jgi:uncharacterized protein involved in outer membrane biogenesis
MGKLVKYLLGLCVVIIVAIVAAISLVDINQYNDEIVQLVEESTGRNFQIDGELGFGLSLVPTVVIEDVKFGNADWGTKPDMLSVGRLEVHVSLFPLLSKTIKVNRLILIAPEILLETDKKGKGNWVLGIQERQAKKPVEVVKEEPAALPAFAINEVHIEDAKITYKDGITGKLSRVNIHDITVEAGGFDDPMSLTVKAAYDDIPVNIEGTLGTIDQLMANKNYPIKLSTTVSDATLGLDGHIARPKDATGLDIAITFSVETLAKLSKLSGGELPDFGPVILSGKLTDIEDGYSLKSLAVKAGESDLAGEVTVLTAGKQPAFKALLTSNILDLAAFSGDGEGKQDSKKKDKDAKVFPSDPLPLDGLKSANIDLNLTAKKIQTKAATLENIKLVLTLSNGKLSIKPLNAQLAGGTLESAIVLDGSGKTAALVVNLNIKNLQPGMLPHLKDKITGSKTDVTIKANGSGKSIAEIMAGLNGNILVKAGEGQLKSEEADLATSSAFLKTYRMLNPEASGEQGSQIQCYKGWHCTYRQGYCTRN